MRKAASLGYLAAKGRVHKLRRRNHADAAEIQAISIPTGTNHEVIGEVSVRVPSASINQFLHRSIVQIEKLATKRKRIGRAALAVIRIGVVVLTLGVLKPGKESKDQNVHFGA